MFTDVTKNWAYPGIQYCVTHGIMGGMGDGTFAPTGTTTRAQIVQILYNLEGTPAVSGTTPFTDLTDDWYQDAVLCGDVAMGWSSTLISPPDGDLADYFRTLTRLDSLKARVLLPAHGDAIEAPAARLAELPEFEGKTIVVILPSAAERYLSSALFAGVFSEQELQQ